MATRKASPVEETRQRAHEMEAEQKRIGALDSRTHEERGDPWRSTAFLLGIIGITLGLCLVVMLILAGG
jgi:hypothetical protein